MKKSIVKNIFIIGLAMFLCCVQVLSLTVFASEGLPAVEVETPVEEEPEIAISEVKSLAYNSLKITWNRVEDADGYYVYRSTTEDGTFERIATCKKGSQITYTDKKASCGKTYYYKVKAYELVNGKRVSGAESEAVSGNTRPNRVTITKISSRHKKAIVYWKKASGASGYEVYRSLTADGEFELVKTLTSSKTVSWTDNNIQEDEVYYYKMRAYKTVDGEKIYGNDSKVQKKVATTSVVDTLTKYKGRPYRYGGSSYSGWDCSGFVQWVYKNKFGMTLPRSSRSQAVGGVKVNKNKRSTWKKGDVLVYATGGRVSHVGIYLGNGKMIHALNTKYDTVIQGVDYYEKWDRSNNLVAVRRYL